MAVPEESSTTVEERRAARMERRRRRREVRSAGYWESIRSARPGQISSAWRLWTTQRKQRVPEGETFYAPLAHLKAFMKMVRTRENSLRGPASHRHGRLRSQEVPGRDFHVYGGQEKWDFVFDQMRTDGWLFDCPAVLQIFSDKISMIDGHHRTTMAEMLEMTEAPVALEYYGCTSAEHRKDVRAGKKPLSKLANKRRRGRRSEERDATIYGNTARRFGNLWAFANMIADRGEVQLSTRFKEYPIVEQILEQLDIPNARIDHVHQQHSGHRRFKARQFAKPYFPTKRVWEKPAKPSMRVCYQFDSVVTMKSREAKLFGDWELLLSELRSDGFEVVPLGLPMTMAENIEVAAGCDAFVGIDSGMAHLCHSVGVPVVLKDWHMLDICHPNKEFSRYDTVGQAIERIRASL